MSYITHDLIFKKKINFFVMKYIFFTPLNISLHSMRYDFTHYILQLTQCKRVETNLKISWFGDTRNNKYSWT